MVVGFQSQPDHSARSNYLDTNTPVMVDGFDTVCAQKVIWPENSKTPTEQYLIQVTRDLTVIWQDMKLSENIHVHTRREQLRCTFYAGLASDSLPPS